MKRLPIILSLVFGVLSLSFSFTLQKPRSHDLHQATANSECKGWSYYGRSGPSHWAKQFPDDCGKTHQSPVDIINSRPKDSPVIGFDYRSSKLTVNRENYAAHVKYDSGSSISYDGKTYDLEEFHFHLPGEHRIANSGHVMEMHLVHKTDDGNYAVIGVLFNAQGRDNAAFKPIIDNLPPPGSEHGGAGPAINAINLLPANRSYYKYTGSKTTPCCAEGVLWLVLADQVRISRNQWEKFEYSQEGKHNNRPVQRRIRAN